jgi:hypothetical protein
MDFIHPRPDTTLVSQAKRRMLGTGGCTCEVIMLGLIKQNGKDKIGKIKFKYGELQEDG